MEGRRKEEFLEQLLSAHPIKIEPEDIKEEPIIPLEPNRSLPPPPPEWVDNEEFAEIKSEQIEEEEEYEPQIDFLRDRAEDIQKRLAENQQAPLAININQNNRKEISAASPLDTTAFSFQEEAFKIKIVTHSSGDPHEVSMARQIGAYLNRDPRFRETANSAAIVNTSVSNQQVKKVENKETQTENDASLYVPEYKLRNLTHEQRELLIEFRKKFNVPEKDSIKAIKERLQHRIANDNYYNSKLHSSNYHHESPGSKRKRT